MERPLSFLSCTPLHLVSDSQARSVQMGRERPPSSVVSQTHRGSVSGPVAHSGTGHRSHPTQHRCVRKLKAGQRSPGCNTCKVTMVVGFWCPLSKVRGSCLHPSCLPTPGVCLNNWASLPHTFLCPKSSPASSESHSPNKS